MGDEERNSEPRSRIGKITALVGDLRGLVVALIGLIKDLKVLVALLSTGLLVVFLQNGTGSRLLEIVQPGESKDCFQAEMSYPKTVSVSGWQSMHLSFAGRNDCRQRLSVYVAFKAKQLVKARIEAPFPNCTDPGNTNCWELKSIDTGKVDATFISPHLELLKKPLGNPVNINLNWVVYNADTKKQLDADTALIQLADDP